MSMWHRQTQGFVHLVGELPVGFLVNVEKLLRYDRLFSLQSVVHPFGALVEGCITGDGLPDGVDPQVLLERDHLVEDLGHTSSLLGGVDMDDPDTLELAGQKTKLPDDILSGYFSVSIEKL
jgi:hypothetical protein